LSSDESSLLDHKPLTFNSIPYTAAAIIFIE
jgi:hypothetical protein